MPTTLNNGIQLPDKGSVDWYSSMQSNYNLIDTHLGDTDIHVTAEDKANWDSKQGSLSQAQLDAIAQVAINTSDIATLQTGKANASHTHSSSDITDIDDYATKDYVDTSISDLVDNAPDALNTLNELSAALNDDSNFASTVTTALGAKANSADLATVATSGSYTDLTDKPTINDSTITIQKNGSTVDTFTTNGSDKTIDISVPTKTSDLNNDSGFITLNDVPTKTSELTNDSGFLTSHQSLSSCVKNVVTNNQIIKSTGITRGTAPSSAQTFGIGFSDNNGKYIGNIYGQFATDKSTYVGLYVYKGSTTTNGDNAYVRVGYDASGNVYTSAPTPATDDNSTQIATTAFVKTQGYLTSHQSLANYVTTNTDQSISGIKSHSKHISILGDYVGNESSTNARSCLYLKANRDTDGKSGLYVTKFRQNVAQGSMGSSGVVYLSHDILENETRTNAGFVESYTYWANDVPGGMSVYSTIATRNLGTSAKPWTNAYIKSFNGLEPSALGMPDLSKGIDISSYITVVANANKESLYTPPANGWISVRLSRTSGALGVLLIQGNMASSGKNIEVESGVTTADAMLPVKGGIQVSINSALADGIVSAKFFPCLGNV